MAYYPDLSPYEYGWRPNASHHFPGHINIGWLDDGKPFPKGNVAPEILARIKTLCAQPVRRFRGMHTCWWCGRNAFQEDLLKDGALSCIGNGEIHVSGSGIYWVYAAPTLIHHYIRDHRYLPPQEFLDAVERLPSDYTMCCSES